MILPLVMAVATASAESAVLTGRVMTEINAPVPNARILLKCGSFSAQALSDPTGAFRLEAPATTDCRVRVERDGFFLIADRPLDASQAETEVRFILTPFRELVTETEVRADRTILDMDTTSSQQLVTAAEMLNTPFPVTNSLKNAVRIVPGVVQSNRGDLHIGGGGAEQAFYTVDGFNVSDPLTGTFETRLSLEAVQAVEVTSGTLPAEYGKGSAGTFAVRTRSGDDKFRVSATNFIPGIEFRKGIIVGNFTPRVNFSGPWKRGRAWFSDSLDLQYDQTVVPELPKGDDRTHSWRGSNYFSSRFNLTPSNILQTGFLATSWTAPRAGLSALDPRETTIDRRARQWFAHVRDQIYLSRGAVIELGFASNRTFGREIPQGQEMFLITPWGKRGNWFRDARQEGARDQLVASAYLPSFAWHGGHQLKVGIDLNRVQYGQHIARTGTVQFRADGTVMRMVQYEGSGVVARTNAEAAAYLQDQWKLKPGLVIDAGVRWDWDHIIRQNNIAPRLGFAWSPAGHENTKISGGAGYVYDAANLMLLTRPNDQHLLTSYYGLNGQPVAAPAASLFLPANERLQSNGYVTYNVGIEHRFPGAIFLRTGYLGRRGLQGLSFWSRPEEITPGTDAIYRLENRRQDRFDSFEVTLRKTFSAQYEMLASYIRSSARSNAATDITVDEPFVVTSNSGPMAWDTPHRFISWGYLPTWWKNWALAYLTEYRTGFPYSVIGENGRIAGSTNSQRFPDYFEMNLHAEWKFKFRKNLWALRGGINNITGRKNPIVVNNIAGSRYFGTYYGGYGRSVNFRIRWLGSGN